MIEVKNVSFATGGAILVSDVSLEVSAGEFVVIMGPNGAGKSTLLKMIAGGLSPTNGEIFFNNKRLTDLPKSELARERAVLSQHYHIGFPMTAGEIVMMGRYPYFENTPGAADKKIVTDCLHKMDVLHLQNRNYQTLSGGEAQKVQMSRVLAQIGNPADNPGKMLLLDEPVSHLDIRFQHQLLLQARLLCKEGITVIAVLHDINLSLKYADRILFMKETRLVHSLSGVEGLTTEILSEVFGIMSALHNISGHPGKLVSF